MINLQNLQATPNQPNKFGAGSNVDTLLSMWSKWEQGENYGRGYPRRAAGFVSGGGESEDSFDEACESEDRKACAIADRAISDLAADERCAIRNRYTEDVWRYRGPPAVVLQRAMENFYNAVKGVIAWL